MKEIFHFTKLLDYSRRIVYLKDICKTLKGIGKIKFVSVAVTGGVL